MVDVRCGNKLSNIKVCKSSGNPREICIAANAVAAHLKNGARLGECQAPSLLYMVDNFKLLVSPNPAKNSFRISLNSEGSAGIVDLHVLDISGREIEKLVLSSGNYYQIGMNYPPGVYFLKATKGNEVVFEKLVKMK